MLLFSGNIELLSFSTRAADIEIAPGRERKLVDRFDVPHDVSFVAQTPLASKALETLHPDHPARRPLADRRLGDENLTAAPVASSRQPDVLNGITGYLLAIRIEARDGRLQQGYPPVRPEHFSEIPAHYRNMFLFERRDLVGQLQGIPRVCDTDFHAHSLVHTPPGSEAALQFARVVRGVPQNRAADRSRAGENRHRPALERVHRTELRTLMGHQAIDSGRDAGFPDNVIPPRQLDSPQDQGVHPHLAEGAMLRDEISVDLDYQRDIIRAGGG